MLTGIVYLLWVNVWVIVCSKLKALPIRFGLSLIHISEPTRQAEPDWQSFKFTTYDNPYIDPQEIDDARRQLPEVVFEQEYMANPAENAANPFGSQYIRKCIQPVTTMPVVAYGIDLAKSVDWTVIVGLDEDGNVAYFDRFQMDWHNTKQTILRLPKCPILVDSTGVGDPILEDLQREGVMIPVSYTHLTLPTKRIV